jgi:hypothetical protein
MVIVITVHNSLLCNTRLRIVDGIFGVLGCFDDRLYLYIFFWGGGEECILWLNFRSPKKK